MPPLWLPKLLSLSSMRLKGDIERESDDATDARRPLDSAGGVLTQLESEVC